MSKPAVIVKPSSNGLPFHKDNRVRWRSYECRVLRVFAQTRLLKLLVLECGPDGEDLEKKVPWDECELMNPHHEGSCEGSEAPPEVLDELDDWEEIDSRFREEFWSGGFLQVPRALFRILTPAEALFLSVLFDYRQMLRRKYEKEVQDWKGGFWLKVATLQKYYGYTKQNQRTLFAALAKKGFIDKWKQRNVGKHVRTSRSYRCVRLFLGKLLAALEAAKSQEFFCN